MSGAPKKGFWRAVQGEIRGVQSFLLLISLQPPPPGIALTPAAARREPQPPPAAGARRPPPCSGVPRREGDTKRREE